MKNFIINVLVGILGCVFGFAFGIIGTVRAMLENDLIYDALQSQRSKNAYEELRKELKETASKSRKF